MHGGARQWIVLSVHFPRHTPKAQLVSHEGNVQDAAVDALLAEVDGDMEIVAEDIAADVQAKHSDNQHAQDHENAEALIQYLQKRDRDALTEFMDIATQEVAGCAAHAHHV